MLGKVALISLGSDIPEMSTFIPAKEATFDVMFGNDSNVKIDEEDPANSALTQLLLSETLPQLN